MRATTYLMSAISIALILAASSRTPAQMSYTLVEGTVWVEGEAGHRKGVEGALVEVHRVDQSGDWSVQTDRKGHYAVSLPTKGVYLMLVSGPKLMPLWTDKVQPYLVHVVDFVTYPGSGNKFSPDQVSEMRARSLRSLKPIELNDEKRHEQRQQLPFIVTSGFSKKQRAQYFESLKNHQTAAISAADLKAESDKARDSYNIAVWWKIGGEYQRALDEFGKLLRYDQSKDEYFAKVARESIVNIAETHYLWAKKLYGKGWFDQARDHFKSAVEFGNRYIGWAEGPGTNLDEDYRTFLLTSQRVVATSAYYLVKFLQAPDYQTTAIAAADKAAASDTAHKSDWALLKARVLSSSGKREEAISEYRTVIATDPKNADALYEVALLLSKSQAKQDLSDAAGYLRRFIELAPAGDDRTTAAKKALQSLDSSDASSH